jgi:hypothetical protein
MDIILTKIFKYLNYWYHNIAMFIVAHFIAVCFKDIMVSARWRCGDNSALTCRSYVKYCSINYRLLQLLVLRELFTYVRTRPIFSFWFHELCMDMSILQVLVPRIMYRIYKLHSYTHMHLFFLLKNLYIWLMRGTWNTSNYVLYGPFAKIWFHKLCKGYITFWNDAAMKYAKCTAPLKLMVRLIE